MVVLRNISYKKRLYKPVSISFDTTFCYINGYLLNSKFKLKRNQVFILSLFDSSLNSSIILINKRYIRAFFTFLWMHLEGSSHGFKTILYVKGKGLRLQLKRRKGQLCIYLKLGYSHKIFLHLPEFCWAKIFGRRRTVKFYALNYIVLRNLVLKIRSFYPLGLYKVRGFYIENEDIRIIEGKSRLTGFGYYG